MDWREASGEPLTAVGKRHVILHGTKDDDSDAQRPTWSEARVPRHLAHPYEPEEDGALPERIALVGEDYSRNNIVALTRLMTVVPADEE